MTGASVMEHIKNIQQLTPSHFGGGARGRGHDMTRDVYGLNLQFGCSGVEIK
jgi:hypothetical protein